MSWHRNCERQLRNLRRRAEMLRQLRAFFDERGFVEVQTPTLCSETVIDRHLDPISVTLQLPGEEECEWFLQTSPEQSMKRLLALGMGSIYQIGPVFRAGELGRLHNPEFTMAEWYEVGAGHEKGLQLLSDLLCELLRTPPAIRVSFAAAFEQATGLPLFECQGEDLADWSVRERLVDATDWTDDWDDWVNLIFSERVQPQLGSEVPVLITHFPATQAALAVVSSEDPRTAERYELFYRGVELANGYHELLDASVLRERDTIANAQRVRDGKKALPACEKLLQAMERGMPQSCGCALGFDRLVMLACETDQLSNVVAFTAMDS
ncbi:MAG: EF-P lysine aminoacylase EpmA [Pirellula sp.]|nr:EF-P lysine aminoacylase EpmA [Pirellula sp.]